MHSARLNSNKKNRASESRGVGQTVPGMQSTIQKYAAFFESNNYINKNLEIKINNKGGATNAYAVGTGCFQ